MTDLDGEPDALPPGISDFLTDLAAARISRVRRRRQELADFQRDHLERRRHGLVARHDQKLARLAGAAEAADPTEPAATEKDDHDD